MLYWGRTAEPDYVKLALGFYTFGILLQIKSVYGLLANTIKSVYGLDLIYSFCERRNLS